MGVISVIGEPNLAGENAGRRTFYNGSRKLSSSRLATNSARRRVWQNQHRVAVAIEAVSLANRRRIRRLNVLQTRERRDEHKQR